MTVLTSAPTIPLLLPTVAIVVVVVAVRGGSVAIVSRGSVNGRGSSVDVAGQWNIVQFFLNNEPPIIFDIITILINFFFFFLLTILLLILLPIIVIFPAITHQKAVWKRCTGTTLCSCVAGTAAVGEGGGRGYCDGIVSTSQAVQPSSVYIYNMYM